MSCRTSPFQSERQASRLVFVLLLLFCVFWTSRLREFSFDTLFSLVSTLVAFDLTFLL